MRQPVLGEMEVEPDESRAGADPAGGAAQRPANRARQAQRIVQVGSIAELALRVGGLGCQHSGRLDQLRHLAAMSTIGISAIVATSSTCGSHLQHSKIARRLIDLATEADSGSTGRNGCAGGGRCVHNGTVRPACPTLHVDARGHVRTATRASTRTARAPGGVFRASAARPLDERGHDHQHEHRPRDQREITNRCLDRDPIAGDASTQDHAARDEKPGEPHAPRSRRDPR